jgi:3',5'-cyclic AMP phosphodiesterase CpdA
MINSIRIAVLSDLHIGTKALALDLCPHELTPEKQISKIKDFLKIFHDHVQSADFKKNGPIDYLFITGDISNSADPIEFQLATNVLKKIALSLDVEINHIFFTPGNHDVNWPVMKLSPFDFWKKFRYKPLMQEGLIFKDRADQVLTGSFHKEPYFVVWKVEHALVIALNTAAFDTNPPTYGQHNGLIPQESIIELDKFLSTLPFEASCLRVCLLHHHPILYSDIVPNIPDYSALTNASNLLEILSKHNVDIAVHGHKHVPHLQHSQHTTNGHPLTILGAGSFSAELDTKWTGSTSNQFHVIDITARDPVTLAVSGFVSTWNYQVSGCWKTSYSETGLNATEGFGSMSTLPEIIALIDPIVETKLMQHGECEWEDITKLHTFLAHVNTKVAFAAFDQVGKTKGLRLFGEINTLDRKWSLIRARSA